LNDLLKEFSIFAIFAASIAIFGGIVGYRQATTKYAPQLAAAQKDLLDAQANIAAQNGAIAKLKQDAEDRAAKAQAAILAAQQQAHVADQAAQRILTSKPPEGVDKCQAARDAFDEELRQERGVK
jgi:hypothetical protein